jgi:hypothetical protein
MLIPPRPNSQFCLARVARTGGPLLLVEGREDDSDEGLRRYLLYSSPVSGDSKCHTFLISYWVISPSMGLIFHFFFTYFASIRI